VYVKIKYYKFPTGKAAVILTHVVTGHRLVPGNSMVSYYRQYYQPNKKMHICYRVLMESESDNTGLVPYKFKSRIFGRGNKQSSTV